MVRLNASSDFTQARAEQALRELLGRMRASGFTGSARCTALPSLSAFVWRVQLRRADAPHGTVVTCRAGSGSPLLPDGLLRSLAADGLALQPLGLHGQSVHQLHADSILVRAQVWPWCPGRRPSWAATVAAVAGWHAHPVEPLLVSQLPRWDPLARLRHRLTAVRSLGVALTDADRIERVWEQLRERADGPGLLGPAVLLHGDVHRFNAVLAPNRSGALLIDYERVAFGPAESDLLRLHARLLTGQISSALHLRALSRYAADRDVTVAQVQQALRWRAPLVLATSLLSVQQMQHLGLSFAGPPVLAAYRRQLKAALAQD